MRKGKSYTSFLIRAVIVMFLSLIFTLNYLQLVSGAWFRDKKSAAETFTFGTIKLGDANIQINLNSDDSSNKVMPGDVLGISFNVINDGSAEMLVRFTVIIEGEGGPGIAFNLSETDFNNSNLNNKTLEYIDGWIYVEGRFEPGDNIYINETIKIPKSMGNEFQGSSFSIAIIIQAIQATNILDSGDMLAFEIANIISEILPNPILNSNEGLDIIYTPEEHFTVHSIRNNELIDYDGQAGADIIIPTKINGIAVEHILGSAGLGAFQNKGVHSVLIPGSIKTIGNNAFRNNSLTSIELNSGLKHIGISAFKDNDITEIIIPDSVESVAESAFHDNYITKITIGDGVEIGGSYSFGNNRGAMHFKNVYDSENRGAGTYLWNGLIWEKQLP